MTTIKEIIIKSIEENVFIPGSSLMKFLEKIDKVQEFKNLLVGKTEEEYNKIGSLEKSLIVAIGFVKEEFINWMVDNIEDCKTVNKDSVMYKRLYQYLIDNEMYEKLKILIDL